jgi:hypothetical protein
MVLAGTASATVLTSPEGTTYTGSIVATSTNSELDGAFVTVKCGHSEAKGGVESHGGETVGGKVSSLTFTSCNYTTTVKQAGTVTVHRNGTLTSSGAEVSIATSVGTCVFTTGSSGPKTDIGNLLEGEPPIYAISSAKIPRTGGNFLCGSSGTWTGSYTITTPSSLWID